MRRRCAGRGKRCKRLQSLLPFAIRHNDCSEEEQRLLLVLHLTHATSGLLAGKAQEHEHVEWRHCAGKVKEGMQMQGLKHRRVLQAEQVLWHPEKGPAAEVHKRRALVQVRLPLLSQRGPSRRLWDEGEGAIEKHGDLERVCDNENPVVLQRTGMFAGCEQEQREWAAHLRKEHVAEAKYDKNGDESGLQGLTAATITDLQHHALHFTRALNGAVAQQARRSLCRSEAPAWRKAWH